MSVASTLRELLERERGAALAADLDALDAIQVEKRAALDALATDVTSDEDLDALRRLARANVGLIRQLVAVHRSIAGVAAPSSYGADGRTRASESVMPRGAL